MITELKNVSASSGCGMVDEQPDVEELGVLPDLDRERFDVELCPEAVDALGDALVVEPDPLLDGALRVGPGRSLEMLLRRGARRPEQPVVLVEALDQDAAISRAGSAPAPRPEPRGMGWTAAIACPGRLDGFSFLTGTR